jgi:hypothetical protein|tara:strand:+ start:121 stop:324 length:204 start_codon:yes stop_codon:yes gene_type:complete
MTSVDDRDNDATFENEQSTVTLTLKEYDKLKSGKSFITDKSLISVIDKIEELVRALRKHIVRSEFND